MPDKFDGIPRETHNKAYHARMGNIRWTTTTTYRYMYLLKLGMICLSSLFTYGCQSINKVFNCCAKVDISCKL